MNKALIAVDMEYDFLPDGALAVSEGDQVIDPLIALMDRVDIIVLTRDYHPPNHVSFSTDPEFVDGSWPFHCVRGTPGAEINEELLSAAIDTGKPVLLVNKGENPLVEQYSGFDGYVRNVWNDDNKHRQLIDLSLDEALGALSVTKVLIGGLAGDYCVPATAIDSATKYHTTVYMDAVRPVAYLSGVDALQRMVQANVHINASKLT